MQVHKLIAFASITAFGVTLTAQADVLIYASEFSSDPGWATNVPDQMYWNSASERYHVESRAGAGQYAYLGIPFNTAESHKLEFDLTMVRVDYAGGISFGLNTGNAPWGTVNGFWTNYARGDGGTGSTLGFTHVGGSGNIPGPYDFFFNLNTTYRNVVIHDVAAGVIRWRVYDGATLVAENSASGIGAFTGIDRILCQNDNSGGGTAEGYLDNVSVWSIPAPGSFGVIAVALPCMALRRRRTRFLAPRLQSKRLSVGCVAVSLLAVAPTVSANIISSASNPSNGHLYHLIGGSLSEKIVWTAAEAQAVTLGGHLVTINDAAENAWLAASFTTVDEAWIGFTDQTTEGAFVWVSGEAVTYTNWNGGEPNNSGNEDYAEIYLGNSAFRPTWNDYTGTTALFGIVEVVPAPASLPLIGLTGLCLQRRRRVALT